MLKRNQSITNLIYPLASRMENGCGWLHGSLDTSHPNLDIGLTSAIKINGYKSSGRGTYDSDVETLIPQNVKLYRIQNHIYYTRIYEYHDNVAVNNKSWDLYWTPSEGEGGFCCHVSFPDKINQWNMLSSTFTVSGSSGLKDYRMDYNHEGITNSIWYTGFMLIDLTNDFGAGQEPTKEWCDQNIKYFTGSFCNVAKYLKAYVNNKSHWEPTDKVYVNKNGNWNETEKVYINSNGKWEPIIATKLPYYYQELEYIENDNNCQYIDPAIIETNDIAYELKAYLTVHEGNYLFGGQQNSSTYMYNGLYDRQAELLVSAGIQLEYNWKATKYNKSNNVEMTQLSVGNSLLYTLNGNTNVVDSGTSDNSKVYIFACNGGTRFYKGLRIYYFKIKQGNKVIRDFVPCYNKLNSKPGLYDLVGRKFYTNAGSGEFIKGPEIN